MWLNPNGPQTRFDRYEKPGDFFFHKNWNRCGVWYTDSLTEDEAVKLQMDIELLRASFEPDHHMHFSNWWEGYKGGLS
jgi:hypothetical protein